MCVRVCACALTYVGERARAHTHQRKSSLQPSASDARCEPCSTRTQQQCVARRTVIPDAQTTRWQRSYTHTAASAVVTRVTRSLARSLVRAVDRRAHKMCMLQEHFAHTHVLKRSRSRARLFRGTSSSSSCCMPVSLCPRVRVCVCVCCLCCWPVRASWGDCALVHCITLRSVRVCAASSRGAGVLASPRSAFRTTVGHATQSVRFGCRPAARVCA